MRNMHPVADAARRSMTAPPSRSEKCRSRALFEMGVLVRYLVVGVAGAFTWEHESDNLIACQISRRPMRPVASPICSMGSSIVASTTRSFVAAKRLRTSNR